MNTKRLECSLAFHGSELMNHLQGVHGQKILIPPILICRYGNSGLFQDDNYIPEDKEDADFITSVQKFVALKANMLYSCHPETQTSPSPSLNEDQSEDVYGIMPPLESFMGFPASICQEHLYQSLLAGDVVIGVVSSVNDSGLIATLLCTDTPGVYRDIDELDITAFCPGKELPRMFAHQSLTETYHPRDVFRGVVLAVNRTKRQVFVSLKSQSAEDGHDVRSIGLITKDEFPVHYRRKLDQHGLTYSEMLHSIMGFANKGSSEILQASLCIDDNSSFFSSLYRHKVPEDEYAESIRKWQSNKQAHSSVVQGVEMVKQGRQTEAIQHLNLALKIDQSNTEALVARGALYANSMCYEKAIADFKTALVSCPLHVNARTYLSQTTLALAHRLEDQSDVKGAAKNFSYVLSIDSRCVQAKMGLDRCHQDMVTSDKDAFSTSSSDSVQEDDDLRSSANKLRHLIKEEKRSRARTRPTDSEMLHKKSKLSKDQPNCPSASNSESNSSSSSSSRGMCSKDEFMQSELKDLSKEWQEIESKKCTKRKAKKRIKGKAKKARRSMKENSKNRGKLCQRRHSSPTSSLSSSPSSSSSSSSSSSVSYHGSNKKDPPHTSQVKLKKQTASPWHENYGHRKSRPCYLSSQSSSRSSDGGGSGSRESMGHPRLKVARKHTSQPPQDVFLSATLSSSSTIASSLPLVPAASATVSSAKWKDLSSYIGGSSKSLEGVTVKGSSIYGHQPQSRSSSCSSREIRHTHRHSRSLTSLTNHERGRVSRNSLHDSHRKHDEGYHADRKNDHIGNGCQESWQLDMGRNMSGLDITYQIGSHCTDVKGTVKQYENVNSIGAGIEYEQDRPELRKGSGQSSRCTSRSTTELCSMDIAPEAARNGNNSVRRTKQPDIVGGEKCDVGVGRSEQRIVRLKSSFNSKLNRWSKKQDGGAFAHADATEGSSRKEAASQIISTSSAKPAEVGGQQNVSYGQVIARCQPFQATQSVQPSPYRPESGEIADDIPSGQTVAAAADHSLASLCDPFLLKQMSTAAIIVKPSAYCNWGGPWCAAGEHSSQGDHRTIPVCVSRTSYLGETWHPSTSKQGRCDNGDINNIMLDNQLDAKRKWNDGLAEGVHGRTSKYPAIIEGKRSVYRSSEWKSVSDSSTYSASAGKPSSHHATAYSSHPCVEERELEAGQREPEYYGESGKGVTGLLLCGGAVKSGQEHLISQTQQLCRDMCAGWHGVASSSHSSRGGCSGKLVQDVTMLTGRPLSDQIGNIDALLNECRRASSNITTNPITGTQQMSAMQNIGQMEKKIVRHFPSIELEGYLRDVHENSLSVSDGMIQFAGQPIRRASMVDTVENVAGMQAHLVRSYVQSKQSLREMHWRDSQQSEVVHADKTYDKQKHTSVHRRNEHGVQHAKTEDITRHSTGSVSKGVRTGCVNDSERQLSVHDTIGFNSKQQFTARDEGESRILSEKYNYKEHINRQSEADLRNSSLKIDKCRKHTEKRYTTGKPSRNQRHTSESASSFMLNKIISNVNIKPGSMNEERSREFSINLHVQPTYCHMPKRQGSSPNSSCCSGNSEPDNRTSTSKHTFSTKTLDPLTLEESKKKVIAKGVHRHRQRKRSCRSSSSCSRIHRKHRRDRSPNSVDSTGRMKKRKRKRSFFVNSPTSSHDAGTKMFTVHTHKCDENVVEATGDRRRDAVGCGVKLERNQPDADLYSNESMDTELSKLEDFLKELKSKKRKQMLAQASVKKP